MKERDSDISIVSLCRCFGISRQSYYQHEWRLSAELFHSGLIVEAVQHIRNRHQRIGVRKLQTMLVPFMEEHGIKMGRDALFDLLSLHGLLVRKRKRSVKTTQSCHWLRKYPNLITGFTPSNPNELWVSDITYWKIGGQVVYISLITDACSHKIVGYHLSDNLHADQTIKALKMALLELKGDSRKSGELIHHSDRGVQYCSGSYVNLLKKKHIEISMTQSGDPLENAVAERVNGIMKDEYLFNYSCTNMEDARKKLAMAVLLYNKERPHNSIGNLTPEVVHDKYHQIEKKQIKKLWKNYYKKNSTFVNAKQD